MVRLTPWTSSLLLLLASHALLVTMGTARSADVAPQQATPTASPSATPAGCVAEFAKTVWPDLIGLGEMATVTLHARPVCPTRDFPLHVVLVLDGSASMAGSPSRSMKETARRFVQDMSLQPQQTFEIGVVDYGASARTLCRLTSEEAQILRCIDKVGTVGQAHMETGLVEGLRALSQARGGRSRLEMVEVMIVMSDCQNEAGCAPALREATQVQAQGVLMVAVCISTACDASCMRQIATSPRYFFQRDDFEMSFAPLLASYWGWVSSLPPRALAFDDTLAEGIEYVPGSASPAPLEVVTGTRRLRWSWSSPPYGSLPAEGLTATYRVQPLEVGALPTNLEATGVLTDSRGFVFTWTFPVPELLVLAGPSVTPTGTATPTATPVEPTASPTQETASATATQKPSPTTTASPTSVAHSVYLPVALRRAPACP